jgi:hypothetical protein
LTKLRTSITAVAILAATPSVAAAQETTLGGTVPSFTELVLPKAKTVLQTFPTAKTYTSSFQVAVTTTEPSLQLSVADGDVSSGSKRGRLARGSKLLPLPVEARVGRTAFAPLDLAVDTPLSRFSGPLTRSKATVDLRQSVKQKAAGRYRKLVLVTVSLDTP